MATTYELEWERQKTRQNLPAGYLPVHRWYLRLDEPGEVASRSAPREGLSLIRAHDPSIQFYRYLYHTAGEEFIWGDRRRMGDDELALIIGNNDIHIMVLYDRGTPAGFFEMNFTSAQESKINYFALLPGFIGGGLGSYMLTEAIIYAGQRKLPLILDTCTLDHSSALENYRKRGFVVYYEQDEEYPDPRLDGTIRKDAGRHVPLAK